VVVDLGSRSFFLRARGGHALAKGYVEMLVGALTRAFVSRPDVSTQRPHASRESGRRRADATFQVKYALVRVLRGGRDRRLPGDLTLFRSDCRENRLLDPTCQIEEKAR
jgi:hypothetical protein